MLCYQSLNTEEKQAYKTGCCSKPLKLDESPGARRISIASEDEHLCAELPHHPLHSCLLNSLLLLGTNTVSPAPTVTQRPHFSLRALP